ncbi:alpha/beta hydrolase [Sphingobium sp. AN558]|uniref:alpha/beta fold hydrolase n=1 Tax=Sphingobium sp. AN558 TaxID=3133442 RepID=UPI0030BF1E06
MIDDMNRRRLLLGAAAFLGGWTFRSPAALAASFQSSRIAVSVTGKGRDVLLIPGLASGPAVWNRQIAALPGFRWHRIQVRGFAGLAPEANAGGPLIQPLADEIARYIKSAGLVRPAIVGHSMGGTLAMLLGLRGVAGRLMVVDMLPAGAAMVGGTARGMGYLADQLSQYFTGTLGGRAYLAQIVAQTPGAQGSDPAVIASALRDLANIDLTARLAKLGAPLEVIYAVGADRAQAADITRRFRAAYAMAKGARLTPIGPSGHVVMADQPARFTAALRDFLTR